MPSFNPTNPPTSLPPSTASVSDWLKSNDAHLIQGPGRPRSGLSEHPPLSPQSSTASSGSGSDTHVEDVQHHSVRNTFMEEGSGMRGKLITSISFSKKLAVVQQYHCMLAQCQCRTQGRGGGLRGARVDRNYLGSDARKPVFIGFVNNKGADQPAHLCSLISAFVIRLLESIISRFAMSEISFF